MEEKNQFNTRTQEIINDVLRNDEPASLLNKNKFLKKWQDKDT